MPQKFQVAEAAKAAIAERGSFAIAIPGGSILKAQELTRVSVHHTCKTVKPRCFQSHEGRLFLVTSLAEILGADREIKTLALKEQEVPFVQQQKTEKRFLNTESGQMILVWTWFGFNTGF